MPTLRRGSADEIARLADVLAHGFGFPTADAPLWLDRAGHDHVRVFVEDGDVLGGLLRVPMGQRFGGRTVSTVGLSGVAVRPELRGRGIAKALVSALLREARDDGTALSTLYPSTLPLYRAAGYERAGTRHRIAIDPHALPIRALRVPELVAREVAGCPPEVRALYAATAPDGYLDRGPYAWQRIEPPRAKETKTFTFSGTDGLEAYAVLSHAVQGDDTKLEIVDAATRTFRGARAILAHAAEYRSFATEIVWHGGLSDLLFEAVPERRAIVTMLDAFMIRIVSPERALAERGYPAHVEAELEIALDDGALPEASGRYHLAVANGRGTARRLTAGARTTAPVVRLHERGLASLYASFHGRRTLVELGWIAPDDAAAPILDRLFAGPMLAMRDMF